MPTHKIDFAKGEVPQLSWWDNISIPEWKHLKNTRIELLDLNSIVYKNEKGQVVNTARALGVDGKNASNIKESLLSKGVNDKYLPGVVIGDSLEQIDGFTRGSVLNELYSSADNPKWVFVVGDLAEGSSIEDAKDELGLGLNDHDPSLKSSIEDFKSRLNGWIDRQERKVTIKECKEWVNSINNSFTDEKVATIVNDTLNAIETNKSMEPFGSVKAKKRAAELLNLKKNDVLAFDNRTGASFDKCVISLFKHYDKYNQFPTVVGYLTRTQSKDALSQRIKLKKNVDQMNSTLKTMFKEYSAAKDRGEEDEFEVMKLEGFLPQVLGREDDIVTV